MSFSDIALRIGDQCERNGREPAMIDGINRNRVIRKAARAGGEREDYVRELAKENTRSIAHRNADTAYKVSVLGTAADMIKTNRR